MKRLRRLGLALALALIPVAVVGQGAMAAPDTGSRCSSHHAPCGPVGTPGRYRLIFDDEFSGHRLDASTWNIGWTEGWHDDETGISGPVNGLETACYDRRNVSVRGGVLHLKVTERDASCAGATTPPERRVMHAVGAHVNTAHKFDFVHGVYEVRVFIPAAADGSGCANFPAIWSDGYSWPADGEIDLFECLWEQEGGPGEGQWHIHTREDGSFEGGGAAGAMTGWHTVSYEWTSTRLTFRYDGKVVGTTTAYGPQSPQYLILNNTTGRTWPGPDRLPADLRIDYVRVYQVA